MQEGRHSNQLSPALALAARPHTNCTAADDSTDGSCGRPPCLAVCAPLQCSTYLAWLCCGWSGLHHLLLQRDSQAFLWLTTFGGFGLGLLRELWRIPSYVDEYNAEPYHMAVLRARAQRGGRPWGVTRCVGQYLVGIWYGTVLSCVPPESWTLPLAESDSVPRELRGVHDIHILAGGCDALPALASPSPHRHS